MKALWILGLTAALSFDSAFAQSSDSQSTTSTSGETSVKLEDVKRKEGVKSETGEDDVDQVITNRKLRAETGSKSKYSASASLNYSGGSIQKPFAAKRPNIRGAAGTPTDVALSGSVDVKYRIDGLNSVRVGTGVRMIKPFHQDAKRDLGERTAVEDPFVSYQTVYKALGLQNVTSVGLSATTSKFGVAIGNIGDVSLSQTSIYDFGGAPYSVGLSLAVAYSFYGKGLDDSADYLGNPLDLREQQSDYFVGAYPFFEYVINDRLNFRTLLGFGAQHMRANSSLTTFSGTKVYQSIGLGISVTRDVYLYPNVQFIPEDAKAEETNVALSATLNMF